MYYVNLTKNFSSRGKFLKFLHCVSHNIVVWKNEKKSHQKKNLVKLTIYLVISSHSVETTEIYSHAFLAKISWKQHIY